MVRLLGIKHILTADLLWDLGIAATTTIGGSGGYSSYGDYLEDLKGARLVLAPDRDANGLKYIGNIDRDFPNQIEGYYLAGTVGLWKKPVGGMDIGDDIRDHQLTKEQFTRSPVDSNIIRFETTSNRYPVPPLWIATCSSIWLLYFWVIPIRWQTR